MEDKFQLFLSRYVYKVVNRDRKIPKKRIASKELSENMKQRNGYCDRK